MQRAHLAAILLPAVVTAAAPAVAAEIKGGTYSSTIPIFEDSELEGDVMCTVPATMPGPNACISFLADHVTLRLNGHTITGPVTPPNGCSVPSDTMFGVGIEAVDRTDVKIEGPGIIKHFHRWGILLGSTGHPTAEATVKKVTVYDNCWSGMQTVSTSDSTFEENVFANDAGGSNGSSCGGT